MTAIEMYLPPLDSERIPGHIKYFLYKHLNKLIKKIYMYTNATHLHTSTQRVFSLT